MNPEKPKVTVLMPVYNGEKFLREAMDSIIAQTFTDFEFLVINDGSTDRSVEIIESYNDPRIRLIHNKTNLKLIATLNKGFDLARGDYIARMDCDDISLPHRLARQVAFMESHPEVGVCGAWAKKIDHTGKVTGVLKRPAGKHLEKFLWCPSPIIHPTAIIRRSIFTKHKYNPEYIDAEDYQLWLRVSKEAKLANLKEFLLLYRVHLSSVTALNRGRQLQSSYKAFVKFYGSDELSYEDFLAFIFSSNKMNPVSRFQKYRRLAKRYHIDGFHLLTNNLKYLIYWVLSRTFIGAGWEK